MSTTNKKTQEAADEDINEIHQNVNKPLLKERKKPIKQNLVLQIITYKYKLTGYV